LILIHSDNSNLVLELPLSSSCSETSEQLIQGILNHNASKSIYIMNAVSYYINMSLNKINLNINKGSAINILTIDSNQFIENVNHYSNVSSNSYIKIKCWPSIVDEILHAVNSCGFRERIILDFNRSLGFDEVNTLTKMISSDLLYLEEPASYCICQDFYTMLPPLFADETFSETKYLNLNTSVYKGFVFKAFKCNYEDLVHCNDNAENLSGHIGWNFSGPFDKQFSIIINDYLPIKIANLNSGGDYYNHPLQYNADLYEMTNSSISSSREAIEYLYNFCEYVGQTSIEYYS
jgi:hypothetical protein